MGVPAVAVRNNRLALIAVTGLNLVAVFDEGTFPVRSTLSAKAVSMTLDVPEGDIGVVGAAVGPGSLSGTARYSMVRSTVTKDAPAAETVGYRCPVPFGECRLDATLTVPAIPVTVHTGGGNVAVGGTAGPVDASTAGGDVLTNQVSGPLQLYTRSGSILAENVRSNEVLAATGGGGDVIISFDRVPGSVQVTARRGNVTVVLPRGKTQYEVVASSTSGSAIVSVTVPRAPLSRLHVIFAKSYGGNITIREQ